LQDESQDYFPHKLWSIHCPRKSLIYHNYKYDNSNQIARKPRIESTTKTRW